MAKRNSPADPADVARVRAAIRRLGGPSHVAQEMGITQGSVSGWALDGEVSPGYALSVYKSLEALGDNPSPRLFGRRSWKEVIIQPPNSQRKRMKRN